MKTPTAQTHDMATMQTERSDCAIGRGKGRRVIRA
jgi:hypothetical protein